MLAAHSVMRWHGAHYNAIKMLARLAPGTQYEADLADILVLCVSTQVTGSWQEFEFTPLAVAQTRRQKCYRYYSKV
jgi:hypothetical protein